MANSCMIRRRGKYRDNLLKKFSVGDKVFAKIRGYCAWPARVESLIDTSKRTTTRYNIVFYGTGQTALCKASQLYPYADYKDKFGKLSKRKAFTKAIAQIEGLDSRKDRSVRIRPFDRIFTKRESVSRTEFDILTRMINKEEELLHRLKHEARLIRLELRIRHHLNIVKPSLDQALKYLEELYSLPVNSLMLKKHPQVVETLKKIKNYVGNIDSQNYSEEEKIVIRAQVNKIKLLAECTFRKLEAVFRVPQNQSFLEHFANEVAIFKMKTINWSLKKVLSVMVDPTDSSTGSIEISKPQIIPLVDEVNRFSDDSYSVCNILNNLESGMPENCVKRELPANEELGRKYIV